MADTKWIPLSEKRPKLGDEVLAYLDCYNNIDILSLETDGHGMLYWENKMGDTESFSDVTAWMPLPEPYQPDAK